MGKQVSLPVVVALLLSACSASIPVTPIGKESAPDHEGTLLVLPRTSLTVKYDVVTTTFNAGKWTDELERCEKLLDLDGNGEITVEDRRKFRDLDTKKSDFATDSALKANEKVDARALSCLKFIELELASKRFPGKADCKDDSFDKESRKGIDAKSVAITSAAVPDPEHVYWVSTPARWLSGVEVLVKYTPAGTVDGAKSTATNPWSDFAVNATASVLKTALGGAGSDNKVHLATSADAPLCVESNVTLESGAPPILSSAACKELHEDLEQLKKLSGERNSLLTTPGNPDIEAQVAQLDTLIDGRKAMFQGTTSKETESKSTKWIPELQRNDEGQLESHSHSNPEAPTVAVCNGEEIPRSSLRSWAEMTAVGVESHNAWEKSLIASSKGFRKNFGSKSRGFPYRVPVETLVSAVIKTCKLPSKDAKVVEKCELADNTESDCECSDGKPAEAALAVAQFGGVSHLTPRAGGRKGTIEVDYNGDTGALVSVQVAGEGSDPKPITDVLQGGLQSKLNPPAKPSEMDRLKQDKDRFEAMAAICTAYANLAAEAPDYCKE